MRAEMPDREAQVQHIVEGLSLAGVRIASREIFLCPLQASLSLRFCTGLSSKIATSLISSVSIEEQAFVREKEEDFS
jgi:hypothetical protein